MTNTHSFISSESTNDDIFESFGNSIGNIFLEGTLDEDGTNELLNGIIALRNKVGFIYAPALLLIGIASAVDRIIENRPFCLNALRAFDSFSNSGRGKTNMGVLFLVVIIALFR